MTDLLAVRTPIYESVADVIIDTDGLKPDEIAKKIMGFMQ
jgi:shikimate kinase